jgi:hypothetical protein
MSRFRLMKQLAVASVFTLAAGAASAEIITIDFDEIGDEFVIESYTESGFIITSLDTATGFPHLHPGFGNLMLHSSVGSSPYQIRRVDGGSFGFRGFDYLGGDSLFVADTGASFGILGEVPLTHYDLSGFTNVNYVNWYMNTLNPDDPFGEQWGTIDNIVMEAAPVPEPAPAALLGLGLAGLFVARRSRKA